MTSSSDNGDNLSIITHDDRAAVCNPVAKTLLTEKIATQFSDKDLTATFEDEQLPPDISINSWKSLMQENKSLRFEISNLTGALKARDIEIATLRESCARLTKSMEGQDESFAQGVSTPPLSTSILYSSQDEPIKNPRDILNCAIDRILSSPVPKSTAFPHENQKQITTPTTATTSAFSSPLLSSSTKSLPSLRSLERVNDEEVAKSAGFLRQLPSRRKMSGRLSVSDFGLLDDNQQEMDTLFAEIDHSDDRKKPLSEDEIEIEMSYAEFLNRLRLPASRDLLDTIRLFLESILGPHGDGTPPHSSSESACDFYGTYELKRRCIYFFQTIDHILSTHVVWQHTSETTLANARDGIEKYVMDKLCDIAMNELEECSHWREEDERLVERMHYLRFITPDMLDIKPCMQNEVVWSMAEDELRRINSFRCPGDKIQCIVRCCSIIFSVLNLARGDDENRPGADDFLPVFIYIVLHSKIPRLYSNCEYIAAYRNSNDLMSRAGYCFVNLQSAIEFISVVDASMLTISESEFHRLYHEAQAQQQ